MLRLRFFTLGCVSVVVFITGVALRVATLKVLIGVELVGVVDHRAVINIIVDRIAIGIGRRGRSYDTFIFIENAIVIIVWIFIVADTITIRIGRFSGVFRKCIFTIQYAITIGVFDHGDAITERIDRKSQNVEADTDITHRGRRERRGALTTHNRAPR